MSRPTVVGRPAAELVRPLVLKLEGRGRDGFELLSNLICKHAGGSAGCILEYCLAMAQLFRRLVVLLSLCCAATWPMAFIGSCPRIVGRQTAKQAAGKGHLL